MAEFTFIEVPTRPFPAILRWAFIGGCIWGVLFVLAVWWWLR